MKEDLHLHTYFSPDAHCSMEELAEEAAAKGVSVLCFTDHVEMAGYETYSSFDFAGRREAFRAVREKYAGRVKLLIGLEFGEPNRFWDTYQKVLKGEDYDMIIGSVHTPTDARFDRSQKLTPEQHSQWHYEATLQMVKKGGFDVLGHLDFPKKFVSDFIENVEMSELILDECIRQGIVPEINTSTLRRGLTEPCPTMKLVEYYATHGGRYVTIGSDSHTTGTVAADYDWVMQRLPKGLEVCYFEQHKLVPLK